MPLLRLADSRGIEINNYGIEQLNNSINNFIKKNWNVEYQMNLFIVFGIL